MVLRRRLLLLVLLGMAFRLAHAGGEMGLVEGSTRTECSGCLIERPQRQPGSALEQGQPQEPLCESCLTDPVTHEPLGRDGFPE